MRTVKLVFAGASPAVRTTCTQMPRDPAACGAAPEGWFCGDGTLMVCGAVPEENAVIATEGTVCRVAMVLVSLSALVSAKFSVPDDGSACLMICATVSAVVVLLSTAKTFS